MPDRTATLPPDTRSKIPSRRSSASWTRRRGSPFAHRPGAPRLSWRRPCSPRRLRICFQNVPRVVPTRRVLLHVCAAPSCAGLHLRGRWMVSTLHKTRHFHVKPPHDSAVYSRRPSAAKFLRPARRSSPNLRFRVGDMSAYAHELVDNGKDGRLVRALHMMRLRCVATPKTNTPLGPCPHIHGGARHSHAQRGAADHTGQGRPL